MASCAPSNYSRRKPEETILYQMVQQNWESFRADIEASESGTGLPSYVIREFESYLRCGILAHGFLRIKCEDCKHEKLIAFSCKRRGFCSSCCAKRMSGSAAFWVDFVFPHVPIRQWVISFPLPLRFWMAKNPELLNSVLTLVNRAIDRTLRRAFKREGRESVSNELKSGAITYVQRFGGALNANIHFHILFLDGVYSEAGESVRFHELEMQHQVLSPDLRHEVRRVNSKD